MGKKSGGSAPDTAGAAAVEGQYGRQAARDETYANRPDQYNPFGNLTWQRDQVRDPSTGEMTTKFIQRQNLGADMQHIFDNQMYKNKHLSNLSTGMAGRIGQEMGAAPDWAQFGGVQGLQYDPTELRNRAEAASYGRATSRLDPQWQQSAEAKEIELRNKGLKVGDQAYDAAMGNFNRDRNDAYEQARMGAVNSGRQEAGQLYDQQLSSTNLANSLRDQQIQEYINKRGFSLGEQQALDPAQNVSDLVKTYSGG